MKSLFPNIFEGMMFVIGAFQTSNNSFFTKNTLVNDDFVNQFRSENDKILLNKTISDLKGSAEKSKKIKLSNHKEITIVVD